MLVVFSNDLFIWCLLAPMVMFDGLDELYLCPSSIMMPLKCLCLLSNVMVLFQLFYQRFGSIGKPKKEGIKHRGSAS